MLRFRKLFLGLRLFLALLLVFTLAAGAVGAAAEPKAKTPLGQAYLEAYLGQTGSYDPAHKVVQPETTHFDIQIKAAHNGADIFFQYTVPTPIPSYFHDVVIYQDGKWVRAGKGAPGPNPDGLSEDRINMFVDDGSVKGFANFGGWLTCHEDMVGMYNAAENADVQAHPVLGQTFKYEESAKYIPQSRDTTEEWWQAGGWDNMSEANLERYKQTQENGVFLDLWHWRSNRSDPIGYSDNQFVFDSRKSSPGKGPYSTNWDSATGQPKFMFDPAVAGFHALKWDQIQSLGYDLDSQFYLAEGFNAIPFDPKQEWKNGDVIPRRALRTPNGSRGSILSDSQLTQLGPDAWQWQVELTRPMDTGVPQADKAFKPGRTYSATVAIHRLATGGRWHFVSLPFTIGIDTPAKVTASKFEGDRPDWSAIPSTTLTVIYPGQTNWEWITGPEHPGASQVQGDTMSVVGCHDEIGLGAANKAIETQIAGVGNNLAQLDGPLTGRMDPGNTVFIYILIAVGVIVGSVGLGKFRNNGKGVQK